MSSVNFYLLDSPRLEQDGRLVQVDTRKAIALLAYLAVTGKQHGRDTLAALLWPDYSQSNARAALRRTLSALHRSLGWQIIEASREVLTLPEQANLWVDVKDFYSSLQQTGAHGHTAGQVCPQCIPYLERAVKLYRSHFMSGFTLRDSISFDDWQFMQSESLRRELAGALERLVMAYTAEKRYEDAISGAQRWLSLDSLHEPAHRQLMQLYALAGKRSAALRQYLECVRILNKELGVQPLEETNRLYLDIKERRGIWAEERPEASGFSNIQLAGKFAGAAASVPEQQPLSAQASRLPMVGRQAEWEILLQAYRSSSNDGFFLALEGEAGMGKTRLAEEFISFARSQGAAAIQARCYPGEASLAYAPFVDGLTSAIDQPAKEGWFRNLAPHWLSEAARLLPNISRLPLDLPSAPSAESPGAQTRFFEGISQVILALCSSRMPGSSPPGILFLDDLQWADEATLDLLTYLVRRLKGHPLFVLVAWRGENLESGHRLRMLLAETQRRGRGELLMLSPLTQEAVKELVGAAVEGAAVEGVAVPEDSFSLRLYQETEGLPFFLAEYLTILPDVIASETTIGKEGEAWPIPHGVRDLLHSRMEQTGETGIQLLQTAAVIGRSFDFDTLHAASGRTEDEAVSTLEDLIGLGLIRESQPWIGGSSQEALRSVVYDFSHEKLRSLVYNETSLARRRLLHVRTAEALLSRFRSRQDLAPLAGQIAFHYKQGGKAREAAEYYRLAGDNARGLYANSEALAHYQASLSLGHPDSSGLNEDIAGMYTLLGNYSAAIASYETALAQLDRAAPGIARLAHKLGNIYHRLGEWEQAESYFQASADSLAGEGDPGTRARLYADWSLTMHQRGQTELAWEKAHQALELAEQAGDTLALAQAHNILGILARSQGQVPEAIRHLERSLDLAESMQELSTRIAALNNLSLALAASHNVGQAIEYARRALEYCVQMGDRHREAALQNNLADLYHAAGDEEQAMFHLKQAVAIFSEVGGDQSGEGASRTNPEIWKLTEW